MQSTINNEISYVEIVNTNGQEKTFPKNLSFVEFDKVIHVFYRDVNLQIKDIANILAINDKGVSTPVPATLKELYDLLKTFFFKVITPLIDDSKAVDTFGDLPDPTTTNGEIWFVKQQTGVWLLNTRKQSGTYISDGAAWIHTNDPLQYWIDDQVLFKDGTDLTKQLAFELEDITTGTTRTVNWPDKDGVVTLDASNVVHVESLADFPTPVAGFIPLVNLTIYVIHGIVDIGANGLDFTGVNVKLRGVYEGADQILSTTAGNFIKGLITFGVSVEKLTLKSLTADKFFNIQGTGNEIFHLDSVICIGANDIGNVSDIDKFLIKNETDFQGFSDGFLLGGAFNILLITNAFTSDIVGVFLDLGTSLSGSIEVSSTILRIPNGGTGIKMLPDGGNFSGDTHGLIFGNEFLLTGTGVATDGYSPFDLEWNVYGNEGLLTSDRFLPTGWGNYRDGEVTVATQALTTVAQKLLIDGDGGTTDESFLPNSIRGLTSLWDTVNNKITPISEGDSYDLRIDLEVTAKAGGVGEIIIELDIGGGAAPTIVIVTADAFIAKTVPFTKSANILIFSGATFIANGGQIFLRTDTGTATIAARGVVISRNSSGAS